MGMDENKDLQKGTEKDLQKGIEKDVQNDLVYLAQSDTTVGLLSLGYKRLNALKQRPLAQKVLFEMASLSPLLRDGLNENQFNENQFNENRFNENGFNQNALNENAFNENAPPLPRVPKPHRALVRHAKKTTFIIGATSFRVSKDTMHNLFLGDFTLLYSTSANYTGRGFVLKDAIAMCDVIVRDARGLYECAPSRILKLGRKKIAKIR